MAPARPRWNGAQVRPRTDASTSPESVEQHDVGLGVAAVDGKQEVAHRVTMA